jgi:hypothetical protein
MSSMSRLFIDDGMRHRSGGEIISAYQERLVQEEIERIQRRSHDLAEQRSVSNSSDTRIRVWEKTHELRLPSNPTHPILNVIAQDTGLTRAEVRKEQRRRRCAAR